MSTITERVAAGAAFLDQHDPEWWRADVERAIDLGTLELHAMDACILGQRCPVSVLAGYLGVEVVDASEPDELASSDWVYAYRAYGIRLSGIGSHVLLAEWAQGLGFNAHGGEDEGDEFDALTAEWKRVITERRTAS